MQEDSQELASKAMERNQDSMVLVEEYNQDSPAPNREQDLNLLMERRPESEDNLELEDSLVSEVVPASLSMELSQASPVSVVVKPEVSLELEGNL